jgi:hypothetical protein
MRREREFQAYQIYVTDSLRQITENTAKYGGGGYIKARYYDILHPKPEETRTAEEIVEHVTKRLKGGAV